MKILILGLILPLHLFAARNIVINPFKTQVRVENAQILPDRPSSLSIECLINNKKERYSAHELIWKQHQGRVYELELPQALNISSGTKTISPSKCYALIDFWTRDETINMGELALKEIRIPLGRLGKSAGEFLKEVLSSSQINLFAIPHKGKMKAGPKVCL